jgi:predicted esterase
MMKVISPRWLCSILLATISCAAQPTATPPPGQDVRHSYRSAIDDTDQPYRLYVPTAYDGQKPFPLVIAMHGTGGNENGLFEDKRLPPNEVKRVAEKHSVLMVCPLGRGTTEYRGIGENDIFCVLADMQKRYRIDPDRIYVTGQSMGGTGAAYLALHHPDLFAASAPLAAAYSFPWLAANGRHVPFWWIQGAKDSDFYLVGVTEGVERMRQLGQDVRRDLIPDEEHPAGLVRIDAVIGWLIQHRRVAHPRDYVFEIDTTLHGRAYWTDVDKLTRPGKIAVVRARAESDRRVSFELDNVSSLAFFPDPQVFDLKQPVEVIINGKPVHTGLIPQEKQLRLVQNGKNWAAKLEARSESAFTMYRNHPVATASEALDNRGTEPRLANWIADAMRDATGADIAIYNRMHDRGRGIPAGTVDIVDLIQCSLPFDQRLVTAELTGKDLLEILDANVPDPKQQAKLPPERQHANRLIQVSGMRYAFDPSQPKGKRIVSSDLQPERRYVVAMEGQVVQRETAYLAGRFKQLKYTTTEIPFTMALYGYASKKGKIESHVEGRVQQVGAP